MRQVLSLLHATYCALSWAPWDSIEQMMRILPSTGGVSGAWLCLSCCNEAHVAVAAVGRVALSLTCFNPREARRISDNRENRKRDALALAGQAVEIDCDEIVLVQESEALKNVVCNGPWECKSPCQDLVKILKIGYGSKRIEDVGPRLYKARPFDGTMRLRRKIGGKLGSDIAAEERPWQERDVAKRSHLTSKRETRRSLGRRSL